MIASLLVLPIGLWATQITISEVSAERDGGRLAITVNGDAMIDPEAASAKMADGRLYLYLRDARVKEANRAWRSELTGGGEEIRAHRHKHLVELVVPLGDEPCQGPVEFDKAPGGLRALVTCDDRLAAAVGRAARRTQAARAEAQKVEAQKVEPAKVESAKVEAAERPAPVDSAPAVSAAAAVQPARPIDRLRPRPSAREAIELKAALALAPEPKAPLPATPETARAPALPAGLHAAPSPAAAPALLPAAPPPGQPAAASASKPSSGGPGGGVMLGGLLLLGLAVGAFFFARRRSHGSRYIEILESATLGPKRSLVVARVGGSTLILGSSEAGITLLQSLPAPQPAGLFATDLAAATGVAGAFPLPAVVASSSALAPSVPSLDDAAEMAQLDAELATLSPTDGDELSLAADDDFSPPSGQGGLLARLFSRARPANDPPPAGFDDLLEDSFEDQELRRKLSLGLSGRVR